MTKIQEIITNQQKGHEAEPRFMIGEQLKEIAEREPFSAELLERDLQIEEMNLEAVEKHFQEYANKNRKQAKVFCITPIVADKLLREFYGLPTDKPEEQTSSEFIDLTSFL